LKLKLIPKEEKFFDLFEHQAENVVSAAKMIKELFEDYREVEQAAIKISRIEHEGDDIAHQIAEKVSLTFITPMDREDIHALATALDDIVDFIYATVLRLDLYKIKALREDTSRIANIIVLAAEETLELVRELKSYKKHGIIKKRWVEIHPLENEGDVASRAAIAKLFEEETNPIEVIKWKELYEHLETAIDKCEDAANIIEQVVLKNA
jgi:uncharacterized protein